MFFSRIRSLLVASAALALPLPLFAADTIRVIAFPTETSVTFTDDYGDARSGGRVHEGIDLMGKQMMPLYAAVNGRLRTQSPEAEWGCRITITDSDDWEYLYYHVNNDTPGTDDGVGCGTNAYVVTSGNVTKGQLIGYMGDSGNAESVGPHLHFEIRQPDTFTPSPDDEDDDDNNWGGWGNWQSGEWTPGLPINPYPSLIAVLYPGSFDKAAASAESPDINTDRGLSSPIEGMPRCASNTLVKSASSTAVYYCGADEKRYVFPNDRVYFTWYADFKTVKTITNTELAAIPLGGLVTYRPGIKMVKIESLPNVYAVTRGGVLRWIKSPEIAASIYGTNWKKQVDDVSDAFFGSYKIGDPITSVVPKT
jgi:hypothetical protein